MIAASCLNRRLRRLLARPIRTATTVPGADAYRKHFPVTAHCWFLLWHGLSASPSLRQSHAIAGADSTCWTRLGLPSGRVPGPRPWEAIHLVDSTFLTLSGQLAPWSRNGNHPPGLRVHTGYDLAGALPDHLSCSLTDTHDVTAFRERDWTPLRGWTVVMDLGYYSHRVFAALRQAGVSWLCPLHDQAQVVVTAPHPVAATPTADGDVVLADATITLGSANNRNGAVLTEVRQVTSRNRHGVVRAFVTDRHDLPAADVVTLSRQRWQIELFFRWLKHQLGVLHPLGHSPQAVLLTRWLAVIVAVLLTLLTEDRPRHLSDVAWLRAVGHILFTTIRNSG